MIEVAGVFLQEELVYFWSRHFRAIQPYTNDLSLIARAHQLVMEGFSWSHQKMLSRYFQLQTIVIDVVIKLQSWKLMNKYNRQFYNMTQALDQENLQNKALLIISYDVLH